jgi:hypothetical protein
MAGSRNYPISAWRTPLPQMHTLRFQWENQRQVRKNRRRAHAAGVKNAFKR